MTFVPGLCSAASFKGSAVLISKVLDVMPNRFLGAGHQPMGTPRVAGIKRQPAILEAMGKLLRKVGSGCILDRREGSNVSNKVPLVRPSGGGISRLPYRSVGPRIT